MVSAHKISQLVHELRQLHIQIVDHPKAGKPGFPNPPASLAEIEAFEKEKALRFPASYREFLLNCNGWRNFLGCMTLFSLDDLRTGSWAEAQEIDLNGMRESFVMEKYGYVWTDEKDDYQWLFLFGEANGTLGGFLIDIRPGDGRIFQTRGYVIAEHRNLEEFLQQSIALMKEIQGT
jgi:hypothetical protein